jgi:hypothetical protein
MTHIHDRAARLGSFSLAALLIVAACGSSATPTPATGGASQAPITGTSQAPTSQAPVATDNGTSSGGVLPSGIGFNQAPDLEALLPSQLCGGPVIKQSYGGASAAGASANPLLGAFAGLGAGGDVAIAVDASTTPDTCPVSVFAYRIKGASSQMFSTVLAAMAAGGSSVSLGGKTVTMIPSGATATYIYTKDDTLYGVSGGTSDQSGQALQALP